MVRVLLYNMERKYGDNHRQAAHTMVIHMIGVTGNISDQFERCSNLSQAL